MLQVELPHDVRKQQQVEPVDRRNPAAETGTFRKPGYQLQLF
jgi:hypothetical protein